MRLYHRSKKVDLNDTICLCDFDADHGRVKLALERLADLEEEVGEDAKICYSEGLLLRDFLGQGQQAFNCFVRALKLNPQHILAACNAALLAPSEVEFRHWVGEVQRLSPSDAQNYDMAIEQLEIGGNYYDILLGSGGKADEQIIDNGTHAAILEIALQGVADIDEDIEVQVRRFRAQSLRVIDQKAEVLRDTAGEYFAPDERLSLQEAIRELDRAIKIDEYDAELWNLRSAWCMLLEQYEEGVTAANRAISLRPTGYPKPYHNKANALWNLGRDEEAISMVTCALQEARAMLSEKDLQMAESLLHDILLGHHDNSEQILLYTAQKLLSGTEVRTHKFAELIRGDVQSLFKMFSFRLKFVGGGRFVSLNYIASVAQLLAYFPIEAAVSVLRNLRCNDPKIWNCCMEAVSYIAAKGESIMRRDAARLISLLILDEPTLKEMRTVYRNRVLAPSAADPDNYGDLEKNVRCELQRLNNQFPAMILEQSSLTHQEIEYVREGMIERLNGTPFINDSGHFFGFNGIVAAVVVVAVIIAGMAILVK
jgi:tetratricopeptide (TPR) repeat protein